jgi:hypothetical protein
MIDEIMEFLRNYEGKTVIYEDFINSLEDFIRKESDKVEIITVKDKDDNTISISHQWVLKDVYEQAEEMNVEINNIQAGEVLDLVFKNIDNNYGVSWDSIKKAIETVMKGNKAHNKIITNPNFWDCECGRNYIHSKSKLKCEICGADQEDMPDSIQDEIDKYYIDIKED